MQEIHLNTNQCGFIHDIIFILYNQHVSAFHFTLVTFSKHLFFCLMSHLISCDSDKVHGVIDSLQDA